MRGKNLVKLLRAIELLSKPDGATIEEMGERLQSKGFRRLQEQGRRLSILRISIRRSCWSRHLISFVGSL